MISPGNVGAVCRLPPGFDALLRIGRMIHAPLTLTMSLFESRKMVAGGQEQPKWISDTFCYFSRFPYFEVIGSRGNFDTKCTPKLQTAPVGLQMITSLPNLTRTLVVLTFTLFVYSRPAQAQLTLTRPAISPGAAIASDYTCTGADRSPALAWSNAPQSTKTFALVVDDPDAPGGTFIHWVAYNIPVSVTSLPPGVPQTAEIAGGGRNGINGFDHVGYNGPCPPPGKTHHYHFRLFALDSTLTPGEKADAAALESAMKGHVVATTELVGTFER
jgi:Raf kinase inhibitor-like YbhB/YbcL family protein